jgi:hypothetical protein
VVLSIPSLLTSIQATPLRWAVFQLYALFWPLFGHLPASKACQACGHTSGSNFPSLALPSYLCARCYFQPRCKTSLGLGQRPRVKPLIRPAVSLQLSAAEGNGPVDALNKALREPLEVEYPQLRQTDLADYRVRLLESDFSGRSASDSASTTRVTIDFEDESGNKWTTVGAHTSIVEASFRALVDGLEFGIINCDDVSRLHIGKLLFILVDVLDRFLPK